jgi:hypothetical protein
MSQTLSPSSARCYGLARVARVWSVSRASVYRSLKEIGAALRRPLGLAPFITVMCNTPVEGSIYLSRVSQLSAPHSTCARKSRFSDAAGRGSAACLPQKAIALALACPSFQPDEALS